MPSHKSSSRGTLKNSGQSRTSTGSPPVPRLPQFPLWLVALLLGLGTLVAYHQSFTAPFVFDDNPTIVHNASIRQLWPLSVPLSPPEGVGGAVNRPLMNLSLAINYAVGGLDVRSYHAVNLLLHFLAGLAFYGLLRRTLRLPGCQERFGRTGPMLSATLVMLWTVHPLLSESVISPAQRNELLVGLFYLLTLYGLVRSTDSPHAGRWQIASIVACLLGMASKELMVTAPVVVFFFDRAFLADSFSDVWRRRRRYYLGLAASWILLAIVMSGQGNRSGTSGFGLGISPWHYLLTQCEAIVLYLRLSFWPSPLVIDYGTDFVRDWREVWPQGVFLVTLAGLTAWATWRHPRVGWLGFAFFAILSPSSSIVPLTTQTMAEHRMYLPLAAVIVLMGVGLHRLAARPAVLLLALLIPVLAGLTIRRTLDYRSELDLWMATVEDRPGNWRASLNVANSLARLQRFPDAIDWYHNAIRLKPDEAEPYSNLAFLLAETGHPEAALDYFATAARLNPDFAEIRYNWGMALVRVGRRDEAIAQFQEAVRAKSGFAEGHLALGSALEEKEDFRGAWENFQRATVLKPSLAEAWYRAGAWHDNNGAASSAREHYREALRLKSGRPELPEHLGRLERSGSRAEQIGQIRARLRVTPDSPAMHTQLAILLAESRRTSEALAHFRTVTELTPDDAAAWANLGSALFSLGDYTEAARQYRQALRINPEHSGVKAMLAEAERRLGAQGSNSP